MYDDVQRIGWIFTTFAALAIIVACLGLFALSAFMVEQRSKEISHSFGVRRIYINSIFQLLTKNFVKTGFDFFHHRCAHRLVHDAKVAGRLCLQN